MGSGKMFTACKAEDMAAPPPATVKSKVFAQTCNKLSQFMKGRRSFGGVLPNNPSSNLDNNIAGAKEMCGPLNGTMNLFPKNMKMEKEGNVLKADHFKSLNTFFPLMSSPAAMSTEDSTSNKNMADYRELPKTYEESMKTSPASMTIFYGGRVLVFKDLPEDKAQEIMSLASQGTFSSPTQIQTQTQAQTRSEAINTILQEHACLSDLPIARRVSLHRFMEKRKDRIAANAPYASHNISRANHEEDTFMTRNMDQRQDHKLELKLFQ